MNIYELSKEEVINQSKKFNKTNIGYRAKCFSMIPFILMIASSILAMISLLNDQFFISFSTTLILFFISFIGFCITQIQYGKMFIDYLKLKK